MQENNDKNDEFDELRVEVSKRERLAVVKKELVRVLEALQKISDERLRAFDEAEKQGEDESKLSQRLSVFAGERNRLNSELKQLLDENAQLEP